MSLTVMITYTGKEQAAQRFMEEMLASGLVEQIKAQPGNERYDYYLPVNQPNAVLLIDRWTTQEALDLHHQSSMMQKIAALRKKYHLRLHVETFTSKPN